jgi:hypothetical protein
MLWGVEVELVGWPRRRRTRTLRKRLAVAPEVVRVPKVPLIWSYFASIVLRTDRADPTVKIEVVADSPGAAHKKAEVVVTRALSEMDAPALARPWIISTDGDTRRRCS